MRLLVNAVGLRAGGGLTVGLNCLRGLRELRPDAAISALVPADCGYEPLCAELDIACTPFRKTRLYPAWRVWFDQVLAPAAAARWSADLLFTMNNQPAWRSRCPQVLLFHNPYYIYPVAEWWPLVTRFERASLLLQRALFAAGVRRCARVAVQTRVAGHRLRSQYGVTPDRLAVIPNALALEHHHGETPAGRELAMRMAASSAGRVAVLTLARYYPHKNLEFIVQVAQALREAGDGRFMFFITVAADQHAGARTLLRRIADRHLTDTVVNLGPIGFGELRSAYATAQLCLLPTVLESMSGTYLEAMYYGLPIVTADRDFAREVCGSSARYFASGDVGGAIAHLGDAAEAPRPHPAVASAPRAWLDVCRDVVALLNDVHRTGRAPGSATGAAGASVGPR